MRTLCVKISSYDIENKGPARQDAPDRLKEERDLDDKTLTEKIEAKYKNPAYIEELIS